MKSKRFYVLSILYIALYAILVKLAYPELEITALTTVIALLGLVSAVVTNSLLAKVKRDQRKDDV